MREGKWGVASTATRLLNYLQPPNKLKKRHVFEIMQNRLRQHVSHPRVDDESSASRQEARFRHKYSRSYFVPHLLTYTCPRINYQRAQDDSETCRLEDPGTTLRRQENDWRAIGRSVELNKES
ncbi:hypothetical protein TIFTF001_000122 [Ficus carica]|uniref:Uncharacterized protein n=1 Tax=Ficus carica TaxID=3494 RepID=A0AA88CNH3_FICCA|nr:hypothetical protein TIFTF001_000122 [Ficus carica]